MSRDSRISPLPFYGDAEHQNPKRLLLLSYHFPPGQATGALRWQKFAHFAAERGWSLDVVTLDPNELHRPDIRRLEDLPPDTRVFGAQSGVTRVERVLGRARAYQSALQSRLNKSSAQIAVNGRTAEGGDAVYPWEINGWDFTPAGLLRSFNAWRSVVSDDPWAAHAARIASAVADPTLHQCVLSCGPPHAAHLAAARVARRTGLPLVMDLRDPWGLAQAVDRSRASPLFFEMRRRREQKCVGGSALVVVNSETHLTALKAIHARAADRIVCILNGYDAEPIPAARRVRRFTIAYAGNIYLDRDPRPLFSAAADVVRRNQLTPDQFGIDLIGSVEMFGGRPTADVACELGLDGYVHIHGRRPRAEALEFLSSATMLLSLPQDLDLSVPSKIYEYFQFEAWLLAIARRGSGTELVLRGTGADVVPPDDTAAIAGVIERRYRDHASGTVPPRLADTNPHLTRSFQADRLFDVLDSVLAGAAVRAGAHK